MKSILVKNIRIQFDSFDEGADQHNAINTLHDMNSVLQERFPDITPQIFVGEITADDIEIADQPDLEDEDMPEVKAECIRQGLHLIDCDDDGFCNHCGHQ